MKFEHNYHTMKFNRTGNTLHSTDTDTKLHICHRKHPTPTKPSTYLLREIGAYKGYFSSLYPIGGNTYRAEYGGRYYVVTLTDDGAVVEEQK